MTFSIIGKGLALSSKGYQSHGLLTITATTLSRKAITRFHPIPRAIPFLVRALPGPSFLGRPSSAWEGPFTSVSEPGKALSGFHLLPSRGGPCLSLPFLGKALSELSSSTVQLYCTGSTGPSHSMFSSTVQFYSPTVQFYCPVLLSSSTVQFYCPVLLSSPGEAPLIGPSLPAWFPGPRLPARQCQDFLPANVQSW